MDRLQNNLYIEDVEYCVGLELDWRKLDGADILISGATGMVGTFLTDVLMLKSQTSDFNCNVVALGRSTERARARLPYFDIPSFRFIECDISSQEGIPEIGSDVAFHFASTTHPVAYATDPIGTIDSNVKGTNNLIRTVSTPGRGDVNNFILASTVEIYGENRGDVNKFTEDYCGYINCNTLRAGYPESKRTCEALCQAYMSQMGIRPVIPRLPRTYGPTLLKSDTKALSQFLRNGVEGEDIVLKSKGEQEYSYLYVLDVVSAILFCLSKGEAGSAYNIADDASDVRLKDLAQAIASASDTSVVYELPDETEAKGFSKVTKALMDASKLRSLGWKTKYSIDEGIERTIRIMKDIQW